MKKKTFHEPKNVYNFIFFLINFFFLLGRIRQKNTDTARVASLIQRTNSTIYFLYKYQVNLFIYLYTGIYLLLFVFSLSVHGNLPDGVHNFLCHQLELWRRPLGALGLNDRRDVRKPDS